MTLDRRKTVWAKFQSLVANWLMHLTVTTVMQSFSNINSRRRFFPGPAQTTLKSPIRGGGTKAQRTPSGSKRITGVVLALLILSEHPSQRMWAIRQSICPGIAFFWGKNRFSAGHRLDPIEELISLPKPSSRIPGGSSTWDLLRKSKQASPQFMSEFQNENYCNCHKTTVNIYC